jgi:hypothetical protein
MGKLNLVPWKEDSDRNNQKIEEENQFDTKL